MIYGKILPKKFHFNSMNLEQSLLQLIRGEKKAPLIMGGLAGLSGIYRSLVAARNWAYDQEIFSSIKLPVPVISVGNIAVGGTGKTPLVHLLAKRLQEHSRLAILTRGFRSQFEKTKKIVCISQGNGPLFSSLECGDEPYLLAQKTKATIWVGIDRASSGRQAVLQGVNCLLLDDGMQHRKLHRDYEIVVIDGNDPFAQGRFLPWGLLRDSPKRLKAASLIVITHLRDEEHYQHLQKCLAPWTSAPLVGVKISISNKETFFPRKVGLFCGIGQPARFLQTARDLNQEIVNTFFVGDHQALQKDKLHAFAERCRERGAEALLCTEKDFVKLPPMEHAGLPIIPVAIELKVAAGLEHWEYLIKHILDRVVR
jgi:tetraacyldisaccharide 4'-kinase